MSSRRGRFIQPEPFRLVHLGDGDHGKSLVIPLPKGRALRVGFQWRSWCKIGPRRYHLVATRRFVDQYAEVFDRDRATVVDDLRKRGSMIEGDLRPVDSDQ